MTTSDILTALNESLESLQREINSSLELSNDDGTIQEADEFLKSLTLACI